MASGATIAARNSAPATVDPAAPYGRDARGHVLKPDALGHLSDGKLGVGRALSRQTAASGPVPVWTWYVGGAVGLIGALYFILARK